ncbi:MAG TPA: acetylglutamate kinase [Bacillales bacterium]|nr:acetylglutamate kinase [Bacillales bacterium]
MEKIVVLKCGGSTVNKLTEDFFKSVKVLKHSGYTPVIVHGGGPEIKRMLTLLNVESEFVDGLRKTDEQVMEIVEMVLCGKVNKMLVRSLIGAGVDALGVSGMDNRLIEAVPLDESRLGLVGKVASVNTALLSDWLESGIVPVIAPVGLSTSGKCYNINADTAAGAVARALRAEKLFFVTDVPGILKDGEKLENVSEEEVRELIKDGTIYGGMIPKVEAALDSLQGSLSEVVITKADHALMKNGKTTGTIIQRREKVKAG